MEDANEKDVEKSVVEEISCVDPSVLLEVLLGEALHTQALVIETIGLSKGSLILQNMPENVQTDILQEIVRGERIPAELHELALRDILEKVREIESKNYVSLGGIDFAVGLLNLIDRSSEKKIICEIEKRDDEIAEEIKKRMFVFEDIVMLDDRAIQKVLRATDAQELAKALKHTDNEVKEKIFRNMSKNAAAMLKEDMEFMGAIRLKDAEEAQLKIVSIIRRLEECGEIVIARCDEKLIL